MADSWSSRVRRAYVRRSVARGVAADGRAMAGAGGHLLWLDEAGEVHDLGAYHLSDLRLLAWAWNVAYRRGSDDDRRRLVVARSGQGQLSRGLAALPQVGEDGKA